MSAQKSIATIDQFLQSVGALTKSAEQPLSEPGSIGGETSHPVKNVDDRLQETPEGERSAENSKDVKEDQGPPSVENAPEAKAASVFDLANRLAKRAEGEAVMTPGSAADDATETVMNPQPTGEDPANETDSAKAGKEDPGSGHPARTDNTQLDGHKYAFDSGTPLEKLAEMFKDLGENICAQVSWEGHRQHQKQAGAAHANGRQQKRAEVDAELAAQAGWELAGLINGTMDKRAADRMVEDTLAEIIKMASEEADCAAWFYSQGAEKAAEGEMPPDMPPDGGDMPPGMMPPDAGGGMPPGGGGEEDMLAALGGGAPAGGEMPPGGDAGGGAGGPDEEAMQLAQVLEELGVTPEELEAAMAAEEGGAGGGMPPGGGGAGGMPPGGGAPGMEVAAADKKGELANIRGYIKELIGRSRK